MPGRGGFRLAQGGEGLFPPCREGVFAPKQQLPLPYLWTGSMGGFEWRVWILPLVSSDQLTVIKHPLGARDRLRWTPGIATNQLCDLEKGIQLC